MPLSTQKDYAQRTSTLSQHFLLLLVYKALFDGSAIVMLHVT
jgi:hypothetical protein